ncbi:transposase, partial [Streptomyces sp. WAC 01325]|uniref:transposase n=1 Tax=Streptomyces sp. WAC 01325 TaxID=2203202 RepID=UPI0037DA6A91
NTHVSRTMRELIAARLWLTVYQLPPYAPELNPVEGVWSHLKRSLANLTKHNLDQLTALVKTRLKQMQYRPGLIEGLTAKTGLDIQPPQPQPLKISTYQLTADLTTDAAICHIKPPPPRPSLRTRLNQVSTRPVTPSEQEPCKYHAHRRKQCHAHIIPMTKNSHMCETGWSRTGTAVGWNRELTQNGRASRRVLLGLGFPMGLVQF